MIAVAAGGAGLGGGCGDATESCNLKHKKTYVNSKQRSTKIPYKDITFSIIVHRKLVHVT